MKKTLFTFAIAALNAYALNCVQTEFEIRKNEYNKHGYVYSKNFDGYSIGGIDYVFKGQIKDDNSLRESKYYYTGTHLDSAFFPFVHFGYSVSGSACEVGISPDGEEISSCSDKKTKSTARILDYEFEVESEEELLALLSEYYVIVHFDNKTQISGDNPKTIKRHFYEYFDKDEMPEMTALYVYKNGELQSMKKDYKYLSKIVQTVTVKSIEDSVHMDINVIEYENDEEDFQYSLTRTLSLKNDTLYISDGDGDYDKTIIIQDSNSEKRCYAHEINSDHYFEIEWKNDTLVRTEYEDEDKWTYFYVPAKKGSSPILPKKIYPITDWRKFKQFDLLGRPTNNRHIIKFNR